MHRQKDSKRMKITWKPPGIWPVSLQTTMILNEHSRFQNFTFEDEFDDKRQT